VFLLPRREWRGEGSRDASAAAAGAEGVLVPEALGGRRAGAAREEAPRP
jgi:hypothetical protein